MINPCSYYHPDNYRECPRCGVHFRHDSWHVCGKEHPSPLRKGWVYHRFFTTGTGASVVAEWDEKGVRVK